MSLNVLNHLGLRLYSNIPTVLSELVANSYDADATKVDITLDIDNEKIIIDDNGHGMTIEDINDKFLRVGYSKRENGEARSRDLKRHVMGRKGIGKLSLFSIANQVEIRTSVLDQKSGVSTKSAFSMNRFDIEKEIKSSDKYHPIEIEVGDFDKTKGTQIILTNFKRQITYTEKWLKKRLARRFSVLGDEYKFDLYVNNTPITIADRDFFSKVQFLWLIGDEIKKKDEYLKHYSFEKIEEINGDLPGTAYKVSGWIGTVELPSDLKPEKNVNNNKISVLCRGKMAQEDILESFNEGGIYADYLIGELQADFLDLDEEDDIATSSRQKINEDDPRYQELQRYIYPALKKIQGVWTTFRNELNKKNAIKKAKLVHPKLEIWYDSLKTDTRKEHARELFSTIESFHFDSSEPDAVKKKKDLYAQGIVAFEKLRLRESLSELSKIKTADDLKLTRIFADLNDLEANLYYDIAAERVEVIKEFQKKLDDNDKETLLQKYLFDNLWILNPSWERPTSGSEIMEKRVEAEFNTIVAGLTEEERKGRMDIKYRTAAGKHIILELKRYDPSYKVTPVNLYAQLNKYRKGLIKCLASTGNSDPIEVIAVLGKPFNNEDLKEAEDLLKTIDGRIIYYDILIEQSLKSYSDYLEKQKEISKLRKIIDEIVGS